MSSSAAAADRQKKIGVFIVAYHAEATIAAVLRRIPAATWDRLSEVFIFDDRSKDGTVQTAMDYSGPGADKIRIFSNSVNLGYGGNQKRGYLYAIENGFDIVVLLHGDGQYAPEYLDAMIDPIDNGTAEAVFGSRMLVPGAARSGGMPLYKFFGNKLLSGFQNLVLGTGLSEFHSGYRAYHLPILARLPLHTNSNDFHFDTEIIIQLLETKAIIREVPIPTYYGDEICYVNGVRYAWDVVRATIRYGLHKRGLLYDPRFDLRDGEKYVFKANRFSSHQQILNLLRRGADDSPGRVLDLGCGSGELATRISAQGYRVTGIDLYDHPSARRNCSDFHVADLETGLGSLAPREFDRVILADVLEHVRNPEGLLLEVRKRLAPGGYVIASTGNVAHLYIRLMLLFGRFDYTERGILDRTHVRLFTRRTFQELMRTCAYRIRRVTYCPIPFENIVHGKTWISDTLSWANIFAIRLLPGLFTYQIVVEAEPIEDHPSELLRQLQIAEEYVPAKRSEALSKAGDRCA